MTEPTIVDATGLVIGRLSTQIAKKLLAGEEVMVINAEKAVIVGRREDVYADYFEKFNRGDWHGPWIPRMPDQLFRRIVRGMLPYKRARGRDAWHRLQAYIGVPRGVDQTKALRIERASPSGNHPFIRLEEVSRYLGANWHDAPTILPRSRETPEDKARRRAEAKAAFESKRKLASKKDEEEDEKGEEKKAPKPDSKQTPKPAAKPAPQTEKKAEKPKEESKPDAKPKPQAKPAAPAKDAEKKVK